MSLLERVDNANNLAEASYLAVLKLQAKGVAIRGLDLSGGLQLSCLELGGRDQPNVKVFVVSQTKPSLDKCMFQNQNESGAQLMPNDLAIFMDDTRPISRKCSYAIDLGVMANHLTSFVGCDGTESHHQELRYVKIGRAFVDIDPRFATQGTQRLQVIGARSSAPIGSIQVDYLVVKNPVAYGKQVPLPDWLISSLDKSKQLHAGHRGSGSGCRPDLPEQVIENTLLSFNYAARNGADMCELDVMCTKDGVPVIFHDYKLKKTKTNQATQIDQLTLNELRSIGRSYSGIHEDNCKHLKPADCGSLTKTTTSSSSSPDEAVAKPEGHLDTNSIGRQEEILFPTLEQVLEGVDKGCALNIEFKWPQMLADGRMEATRYREINDHVDRIMDCILAKANNRRIVLSTFNVDLAILLRLKQSSYPVLFLTTGDPERFNDPTTKTVESACHFARALDLAGINPNVSKLTDQQVRYARGGGLLVFAWGKIETADTIRALRKTGLDGVIYDRIDLIKPSD